MSNWSTHRILTGLLPRSHYYLGGRLPIDSLESTGSLPIDSRESIGSPTQVITTTGYLLILHVFYM